MTLNISKLRNFHCRDADILSMCDIVEAAAKYKESMDAADKNSSLGALVGIGQPADELWELLDDVEVGDE